ncbi:hypothetical protein CC79DRAFT_730586 [Sarocladium strictum]
MHGQIDNIASENYSILNMGETSITFSWPFLGMAFWCRDVGPWSCHDNPCYSACCSQGPIPRRAHLKSSKILRYHLWLGHCAHSAICPASRVVVRCEA